MIGRGWTGESGEGGARFAMGDVNGAVGGGDGLWGLLLLGGTLFGVRGVSLCNWCYGCTSVA
jgi:hypothetical protein